jgi:hypothetical protein
MASTRLINGTENVRLGIDNKSQPQPNSTTTGFWYQPPIDGTKWNELHPYQLLVLTAEGKNGRVNYKRNAKWVFTLPMSPESIHVATTFAINKDVTQGGIIEQHNGAPVKVIQLQGSLGILPLRGAGETLKAFNPLEGIFGGTLQAATSVGNAIQTAFSNVTGQGDIRSNLVKIEDLTNDSSVVKTSGYSQYLLLRNFLENYVEYKKTKDGKNARLAFAIWKEDSVYLVTPKMFDQIRQIPDVYEYKYQLILEAYKRISLQRSEFDDGNFIPIIRNPNAFARLLKTIEDARLVLQKSKETLLAVVADVGNAIFEPLRQITSFAKDLLGVSLTTQDLPINVIKQTKRAVIELVSTQDVFANSPNTFVEKQAELADQIRELKQLGASLGKSQTLSGDLSVSLKSLEGLGKKH